jgi:hypothetical protein
MFACPERPLFASVTHAIPRRVFASASKQLAQGGRPGRLWRGILGRFVAATERIEFWKKSEKVLAN